jgi:hypothetical protein
MTITYYCVADSTGAYTVKDPPVASPSTVSVIKIRLTTGTRRRWRPDRPAISAPSSNPP